MLRTKDYMRFRIEDGGECLREFSGAQYAGKALPGDKVKPTETGCALVERAEHPPLVGVLELNTKVRYGFTGRGVPLYLFKPLDESYPPMLVASKETTRTNKLALAAFENWLYGATFPRAGLQIILGECGDFATEMEAIAYQYSPWSWTNKRIPDNLAHPSKEGRIILSVPTINIDPPGCKDIDDVVSLWMEGGQWRLAISIADVAAYVALNPKLTFAERIGQTLYSEGRAIRPLFPAALSEDLFSLLPGKERFALSLISTWDGKTLSKFFWKETVLVNTASYTYESCYAAKEIDMGVLQLIAESLVGPTSDSHKWVEALMILYNTEAANRLAASGQGLLRTHDAPNAERLALMESLGLPAKELAYPAAVYSMATVNGKHWGLQKGVYCHASSPIRRYADVLNQGILKGVIDHRPWKMLAEELNVLDKKGKAYERDRLFATCILLGDKKGQEGVVVEMKDTRVCVYVAAWKRILRCPADSLMAAGTRVRVAFHASPQRGSYSWKKRVVYRCDYPA